MNGPWIRVEFKQSEKEDSLGLEMTYGPKPVWEQWADEENMSVMDLLKATLKMIVDDAEQTDA